jgi:tetratricopeptide (TPR) repeat protein
MVEGVKRNLSDAEKRKRRRRQIQRNRIILIAIGAAIFLAGIGIATYFIAFHHDYNNYEDQMNLGLQHYKAGEYEEAEAAFLKALEFEPDDQDALKALVDVYVAWGKFDKAVDLLLALQKQSPDDASIIDSLITVYVDNLNNIEAANALIRDAWEKGMALENPRIPAQPVFTPKSGSYNEEITVLAKTGDGAKVYFTQDGAVPTMESDFFENGIKLKSKEPVIITAVVFAENGLMGWPAKAEYTVNIQYALDTGAISRIGRTAESIMSDVGALFYYNSLSGSYVYRDKSSKFFYAFPVSAFGTNADGTPQLPETTPLPPGAVCEAVTMEVSDLFIGIATPVAVKDLMGGLEIAEGDYTVDPPAGSGS